MSVKEHCGEFLHRVGNYSHQTITDMCNYFSAQDLCEYCAWLASEYSAEDFLPDEITEYLDQ